MTASWQINELSHIAAFEGITQNKFFQVVNLFKKSG